MLKNAVIENCNGDETKIKECYRVASEMEDKHRETENWQLVSPSEFIRNAYNYSLKFKK
jgi:hypothetical protein